MPGKHNAGGCGCCGGSSSCWSCNSPISLTVASGTGTCCAAFDGTFVFLENALLALQACTQQWNITKPYEWVEDDVPTPYLSCLQFYCHITSQANIIGDNPYVCLIGNRDYTSPYCRDVILVLTDVTYTAFIRNVLGVPAITVTLRHEYRETATGFFGGFTECGIQYDFHVVVTDTYESVIDCDDASTVLTHTSRSIHDPDGREAGGVITWGWLGDQSYTICSAPTITLNLS